MKGQTMVARQRVIRKGTPQEDRQTDLAAAEEEAAIPANRELIARADDSRETLNAAVAALRQAREDAGLSLADVQERSGITRGNLSRIENLKGPRPTLATLERLAEAVGCRIELKVVASPEKP
jgi:DNA-binding Xre family transcriptional regulator